MIYNRIFYVWGYGEEKSRLANICIENWRMKMPSYEIIEINEKTSEWFDFDYEYANCLWFKTVYDLKMWAYVADYMRIKTLYDHGGIYMDTDVTVYKSFDDLLGLRMFIGNVVNNLPEFALIGAEKNHPYLKDMLDFYNKEIWQSNVFIITGVFKDIVQKKYNLNFSPSEIFENDYIKIFTPEYFHPYHHGQIFTHDLITPNTYSVHWENGSWLNKKNLFFLSNKHRIPLKILLKQLDFIERVDKNVYKKTLVPVNK